MKVIVKRPFCDKTGIHRIGETVDVRENVFDSDLMEKVAEKSVISKKSEVEEVVEDKKPVRKPVVKKGAKNA